MPRWTTFQKTRYLLYLLLGTYILLDVYVYCGPFQRWLGKHQGREVVHGDPLLVVARVQGQPITRAELDHAISIEMWRRGQTLEKISSAQRDLLEKSCLFQLIDDHLLRIKTHYNHDKIEVAEARIEAEWQAFRSRFENRADWEAALQKHRVSEKEMRLKLRAKWEQDAFLEKFVTSKWHVSDEEVRAYFEKHHDALKTPERRKIRHLLATHLDHPNGESRKIAENWQHELIRQKVDWAEIALQSGDPNSAAKAGELGFLEANRLPKYFAFSVFALEKNQIQLIESELGYHVVEVMDIQASQEARLEDHAERIRMALLQKMREKSLLQYRLQAREQALRDGEIVINL